MNENTPARRQHSQIGLADPISALSQQAFGLAWHGFICCIIPPKKFPASLARFLLSSFRMKEMDDGDFELVEPFNSDGSSLNGVSSEVAFALGVEWQMFRQRLKTGQRFQTLCLAMNTNRLVKMAERQRRFVEDRPTPWAGWSEIWVGDYLA
jgi:hypothetical protein